MLPSVDTCSFVDERLDAYFDGELDDLERVRVQRHLGQCAICAETLVAFSDLRSDLRAGFPLETCPPEVTAAVLAVSRREAPGSPAPRWSVGWSRLRSRLGELLAAPVWRPVFVGAAAACLLAIPLWRVLTPPPPGSSVEAAQLSPAELAQAEREARLVLAMVASIGENAGTKVRQEIMNHRIVEPARRAFGFATGDPGAREQ